MLVFPLNHRLDQLLVVLVQPHKVGPVLHPALCRVDAPPVATGVLIEVLTRVNGGVHPLGHPMALVSVTPGGILRRLVNAGHPGGAEADDDQEAGHCHQEAHHCACARPGS